VKQSSRSSRERGTQTQREKKYSIYYSRGGGGGGAGAGEGGGEEGEEEEIIQSTVGARQTETTESSGDARR
jgi:hypothetical protein